jgi:hypothetical protein
MQAGAGTAVLAVILGLSFASTIRITKCPGSRDYHACSNILISGPLFDSDGAGFVERTKDVTAAKVDLISNGGSTLAGIEIGEQIHARGFFTNVPGGAVCASSCANIWLAGKTREMGPESFLLWHDAFRLNDPKNADGTANVAVGIYLAHLGFSYTDAMRMFGHDPSYVHATYSDAHGQQSRKDLRWDGLKFAPVNPVP